MKCLGYIFFQNKIEQNVNIKNIHNILIVLGCNMYINTYYVIRKYINNDTKPPSLFMF